MWGVSVLKGVGDIFWDQRQMATFHIDEVLGCLVQLFEIIVKFTDQSFFVIACPAVFCVSFDFSNLLWISAMHFSW